MSHIGMAPRLPREELLKLDGNAVVRFASSVGWSTTNLRPGVEVLSGPDGEEAIVPTRRGLADATERLREAVLALATQQKLSPADLLATLLRSRADVVKFRVSGTSAFNAGALPLTSAPELFEGCKRVLLAAACAVNSPRPYYPRLQRKDAQALVNECTVSTERGSFVATVICPLDSVSEDRDEPSSSESRETKTFSRKAIETLVGALATLQRVTTQSSLEEVVQQNPETVGISANLCESILAIAGDYESVLLDVDVRLSHEIPADAWQYHARFNSQHFAMLDALSTRLRPSTERLNRQVFGRVDSLSGEPSPDNVPPSGDIFVIADVGERLALLRLSLDSADYFVACEAHARGKYVSFRADIEIRRGRASVATNVVDFGMVSVGTGD